MIKGPKNAVPTTRGWVSPKGELLKSQRITQEQIDEWNGITAAPEPVVEETVELDDLLHTHGDVEHSHDDGDMDHHHHDDGTTHDHDGGEEDHVHEEVKPKKKRKKKGLFSYGE